MKREREEEGGDECRELGNGGKKGWMSAVRWSCRAPRLDANGAGSKLSTFGTERMR
jgi:hypothetical protein